jgi:aminoglycoside phosphotransferase (APT) family kinase protein
MSDSDLDPLAVRERLAEAGDDPGELRLSRLEGGASREVYLVEAAEGAAGGRWVLRRDPPGSRSFVPLSVEHGLMRAAAQAGVAVPAPLGFEAEGGAFGSAGFLMEYVAGESVPPRLLKRDEYGGAREALPAQLGAALARVHTIDPGSIDGLAVADGDPSLAACELWEGELDRLGLPLPAVEAGLRWLRLHAPPASARTTLVHGDFRLGNFIVDSDGLAAVIDWELAHGGDPAEDIGWLTIRSWRFGRDERPVAGLSEIDELRDAYLAAGGEWPGRERRDWWEAMGNVKWAVICARQAADHLAGRRPSHELASLGRRICEPEWDLLQLIGRAA